MNKNLLVYISLMCSLVSCSGEVNNSQGEDIIQNSGGNQFQEESVGPTDSRDSKDSLDIVVEESVFYYENVDYSQYFQGYDGTGVLYSPDLFEYVHDEEWSETRFSPYSTFKIVSTLMGLEEGIVSDLDSRMKYNGSIYWYAPWNDDVTLLEAFQNSCVWYYHQLVYQMEQDKVQEYLDLLDYGNCDLSEWEGNGSNSMVDLNGFWLNSSLKISPKEQVRVLADIFSGGTIFAEEHIFLLKEMMKYDGVFGKTGSGNGQSWFVGFDELSDVTVYFAVLIEGGSGAVARGIALDLISDFGKTTQNDF